MTVELQHEQGCPHVDRTPLAARKRGCRCPQIANWARQYKREWQARRKQTQAQAGRPDDDVDELDVKAAIISYANRGEPVPDSMTPAERRLVGEWLERRGESAATIAHITLFDKRTVQRYRENRRKAAQELAA